MTDKTRIIKLEASIGIMVQEGILNGEFPVHSHEFSELVLICGGMGMHLTGNDVVPVRPGDVYVLKGSEEHGFSRMVNLHLVNIIFAPEKLPFTLEPLRLLPGYNILFEVEPVMRRRQGCTGYLNLTPEEMLDVTDKARRLRDEIARCAPGFELQAAAYLLELIIYIVRLYSNDPMGKGPEWQTRRLGTVIAYIEKHYIAELSLPQLAKMAGLSVSHFTRLFKIVTGSTPMQYAMRRKIMLAERLFRQTDGNVTETALACGFTDSNHFTRMFRQYKGMSPRQYRKLFQR